MKIFIKGRNLRVTQALKSYAEEKIGHLEHYLDHIIDAHVTLRTERAVQIVDVVLNLKHFIIKAEERSPDMYASIDLVRDRLEQQIRKYKTRKIGRHHRANGRVQAAAVIEAAGEEPDEGPRIVRSKRFPVKPMHAEEA